MYALFLFVRYVSKLLHTLLCSTDPSRAGRLRRLLFCLEELETRIVPSAVVQLPSGGGDYQVLFDSGNVVVQQSDGTQLYNAPIADATGLTIEGAAATETIAIDFSTGLSGVPFSLSVNGGGADKVTVNCSSGDDNVVLEVIGESTVFGPGYNLSLTNVPSVWVYGNGGNDTAQLMDTPGYDQAVLTPANATLQNIQSGVTENVFGFSSVTAHSTHGGTDAVWLYDTPGNDVGVMTPVYSYMANDTGALYATAFGFTTATTIANAGGTDTVYLYDTTGNDICGMTPSYSFMQNGAGTDYATAIGFTTAISVANSGGADSDWLYDSPGDDVAVITPTYSYMQNGVGTNYATAVGFTTTTAVAYAGGADIVWLYAAPGNEALYYSPTTGSLYGPGQVNLFSGFQDANVVGTGSQDSANLLDSPNTDIYVGAGNTGRLNSMTGNYVLNISSFNSVDLSGAAGGLNVITLTNPAYTINSTGFVSSSTFVQKPLTRAQALPMLKQVAEQVDPALATTTDPTALAILLRNDVQKGITVGANTTEWTSVDAYERYVQAILTGQQPVLCGGTQILYADLLEAFGLQGRYIDLFAADGINTHASVEVQLNNKWVVMDPTFNVSFMDANGQRLSIADVQAGVPYTVSNDGVTPQPRLIFQKYPYDFQLFCYRITYPPTVTN